MYDPSIVDRRIQSVEREFKVRLHRYSISDARYVAEVQLEAKRNPKTRELEGLTLDEQLFIQNELLLSRCDFRYWFERYVHIVVDNISGRYDVPKIRRPQEILLTRLAQRERDVHDRVDRGEEWVDGNCWFIHKARQMGLSTICLAVGAHLTNFFHYNAGLVGSTNEPKTRQAYRDYFYMIWNSLPSWMRIPASADTKTEGLVLDNGSKLVLQHSEQDSGFGQGAKWHFSHLTEVAGWAPTVVQEMIENHYFPSVSRSMRTVAFMESTSQGQDNWWHRSTERARARRMGRWWYMFIPFYLAPDLYISYPDDGWSPAPETLAEANLIERTSPEWNDGKVYTPSRGQLHWWETTREQYRVSGTLNEFYKNHPSTPEQSFTHSGRSSFPYEIISHCEQSTLEPVYYDILTDITPAGLVITEPAKSLGYVPSWWKDDPPKQYKVGDVTIGPVYVRQEDRVDPRGLICLWERPEDTRPHDMYGAVDTTGGIPGWSRFLRKQGEDEIDNGAIQIIRSTPHMDVQVAEFAAPIMAVPLADIYAVLGRLYFGRNGMDDQLQTIVELTSDGLAFQEELVSKYGWIAFYQHSRFNGSEYIETDTYGFKPSPLGIRQMWTHGKHQLCDKRFLVRSTHFVREMRSCTDDNIYVAHLTRGKAPKGGGRHDDRVYAGMYASWFSNGWANPDPRPVRSPTPYVVTEGKKKLRLWQMESEEREAVLADFDDRWSQATGW